MRPHLAHLVLVALVLLANTSGRERDDRSQTHPFIVDLGPMGVDGEVVSGDPLGSEEAKTLPRINTDKNGSIRIRTS